MKQEWLNDIDKEILLLHLSHKKHLATGLTRSWIADFKKNHNVRFYRQRWLTSKVNAKSWGNEAKIVGPRHFDDGIKIR